MSERIVYGRLDGTSRESQRELYQRVFHTRISAAVWDMKHYSNPLDDGNFIYGAFMDDKLVGLCCFVPQNYYLNGTLYRAAQACDACVDVSARGHGILSGMLEYGREKLGELGIEFLVGFPNTQSYKSLTNKNWLCVYRYHKLYLPCDIRGVLKGRFDIQMPKAVNSLGSILWLKVRLAAGRAEELELVCERGLPDGWYQRILLPKDAPVFDCEGIMMDWKMQGGCEFYTVRRRGQELASFLVKPYRHDSGARTANIVGVSYQSTDKTQRRRAWAKLLLALRGNYRLICTWDSRGAEEASLHRSLGFLNNIVSRKGTPFMIKLMSTDTERAKALLGASWCPQMLELDALLDNHLNEVEE